MPKKTKKTKSDFLKQKKIQKKKSKQRTRNRNEKYNIDPVYNNSMSNLKSFVYEEASKIEPTYRIFLIKAHGKACDEKHLKKSMKCTNVGKCKSETEPLGRVNMDKYQSSKYLNPNFFVLSLQNIGRLNYTYFTSILLMCLKINSKFKSNTLSYNEKKFLIKQFKVKYLPFIVKMGYKKKDFTTDKNILDFMNIKFNTFNHFFYTLNEDYYQDLSQLDDIMTELYYFFRETEMDHAAKFSDRKISHARIYPSIKNYKMKNPPNSYVYFYPFNNDYSEYTGIFEITKENSDGTFDIDTDYPHDNMPIYNVSHEMRKEMIKSNNGISKPEYELDKKIIDHSLGLKQNDYLQKFKEHTDKINNITKYNKVLRKIIDDKVKNYATELNDPIYGTFPAKSYNNFNPDENFSFAEVTKQRMTPENLDKPHYSDIYKRISFSLEEVLDIIYNTIAYTEYGGDFAKMKQHQKETNTQIIVIDQTCKNIESDDGFRLKFTPEQNRHLSKLRANSFE